MLEIILDISQVVLSGCIIILLLKMRHNDNESEK